MISKNSIWSIMGSAVPAATALIAIPTLFIALGSQLFAICSLLISLAIFFFVYDFGIARSITYYIAKSGLSQNHVNAAWTQGAIWASVLSCVTSLLIILGTPWFVTHWLNIDPALNKSTILSFYIAAYGIPGSVLCHVFRGVLEGHSDFKAANLGKMAAGSTIFLAPLILVNWNRLEMMDLSIAISTSRYLSLCFYLFLARKKIDIKNVSYKPEGYLSLFKYGVWAAISGLISTLFIYGDRFFVAGYIGAKTLAIYIGSQDILIRYLLLPWSMATVLLPMLAAGTLSQFEERQLYHHHQTKIFWLSLFFALLALAGTWIMIDWFSVIQINQEEKWIISLLTIGVFFAALSQMPLILLFAKGKPKLLTYIYGFEFFIYLIIAPIMLDSSKGIGASLLWAGRLIMEYCLLSYAVSKNRGHTIA